MKTKDIDITTNHNGMLLSYYELDSDTMYKQLYIGYSKKQAIKLFKAYVKEQEGRVFYNQD